jgi:hypothetical protein
MELERGYVWIVVSSLILILSSYAILFSAFLPPSGIPVGPPFH